MNNLTEQDIKFIKNLSNEMKIQDNRGTAQPYGLIIIEEEERPCPGDYGGEPCIVWDTDPYCELSELKKDIRDNFEGDDEMLEECKPILESNSLRDLSEDDLEPIEAHFYYFKKEHKANMNSSISS